MGISDLQKRIITRSRAAARQQIANDMIGSIGAPRSMSRSIEAAIGEPAAVSMPMLRLTAVSPGLKRLFAAIAQHSPNMSLANWLAPAAAMSPKAPRIRQQIPAAAAMKAHFFHISWRIAVESWESNLAPEKAVAIATTRGDFAPFCSPNE